MAATDKRLPGIDPCGDTVSRHEVGLSPEALEAERDRLAKALHLAERERLLLGYEIHDGLVQDLTAAAMLLEGASRAATFASNEDSESYGGGLRLLRESIEQARRLIHGLATVELDERGLCSALERLTAKFRAEHGLKIELACVGRSRSIPVSAQHLLLRIAQEALHNVWKHARARKAKVRMAMSPTHVEVSVEDNGVGFDMAATPPGHFGLEGMRERARVLGAELTIDSSPGKGSRIEVRMPLPGV